MDRLALFPVVDSTRYCTESLVRSLPDGLTGLPVLPPMIVTGERRYINNMRMVLRYLKQVGKACKRQQAHEAYEKVFYWRVCVKFAHDIDENLAQLFLQQDDQAYKLRHEDPETDTPTSPRSPNSSCEVSTTHASSVTSDEDGNVNTIMAECNEDCVIDVDLDNTETTPDGPMSLDTQSARSPNTKDQVAIQHWTTLDAHESNGGLAGHESLAGCCPEYAVEDKDDSDHPTITQPCHTIGVCQFEGDAADEGLEFEFDFDYPLEQIEAQDAHVKDMRVKDILDEETTPEDPTRQPVGDHDLVGKCLESETGSAVEDVEQAPAILIRSSAPKEYDDLLHVFLFPRDDGPPHDDNDLENTSADDESTRQHEDESTQQHEDESIQQNEAQPDISVAARELEVEVENEPKIVGAEAHGDLLHVFLFPRDDGPSLKAAETDKQHEFDEEFEPAKHNESDEVTILQYQRQPGSNDPRNSSEVPRTDSVAAADVHAANTKEYDDLAHVYLFSRHDGPMVTAHEATHADQHQDFYGVKKDDCDCDQHDSGYSQEDRHDHSQLDEHGSDNSQVDRLGDCLALHLDDHYESTSADCGTHNVDDQGGLLHVFLFPREDGRTFEPGHEQPHGPGHGETPLQASKGGTFEQGSGNETLATQANGLDGFQQPVEEEQASRDGEELIDGHVSETANRAEDHHASAEMAVESTVPSTSKGDFELDGTVEVNPTAILTPGREVLNQDAPCDFDAAAGEPDTADEDSTLVADTTAALTPESLKLLQFETVWDSMSEQKSASSTTTVSHSHSTSDNDVAEIRLQAELRTDNPKIDQSKEAENDMQSGSLNSKETAEMEARESNKTEEIRPTDTNTGTGVVDPKTPDQTSRVNDTYPTSEQCSPDDSYPPPPEWSLSAILLGVTAGAIVVAVRAPVISAFLLCGGIAYAKYQLSWTR
ncbi:hypothetical protein A1O3_09108 [Capronia epimyces CBS 606.96]|uniref:Uncharacterized protein n=1 Tax=Capronia epimyces CBS 606.96 TaxID=1182542 RepID=W9Y6A4_9EURO|nr:uncharacterized protein A1O3_09108 [Capronia epimyces CBS 606.96]EXJ77949.1 hypothetical protein A1O3_09108 [Capronia epimyces CBS 606.96]